ncbi:MAG: hypothetical protein ACE5I5_10015 [Candidatus Heimdallarchaeota archaeon]
MSATGRDSTAVVRAGGGEMGEAEQNPEYKLHPRLEARFRRPEFWKKLL